MPLLVLAELLFGVDAGGRNVSCFSVRCLRSCRPFCSGWPGSIRSWRILTKVPHNKGNARVPISSQPIGPADGPVRYSRFS
jgi:hypothetical protein